MTIYEEFPRSTVLYNLFTLSGVLVLGGLIMSQWGWGALGVYAVVVVVALLGIFATTCTRCVYYGRRCGLGAGHLVALLFKRRADGRYMSTTMQMVYLFLLMVGLVTPLLVGIMLAVQVPSLGRVLQVVAFLGFALALGVPHPRLVCCHCGQGACGACPVGKRLQER